jgi:hypothetical protein
MTLKGREELKAYFKNDMRPSQTHFAELIASMLNKRDDRFHGRWQSGTVYRTGDIVVYERAFWEMTEAGRGREQEICSHEPPDSDDEHWRSVVIPAEDSDWFLVDIGPRVPTPEETETGSGELPPATMHANPRVVRTGIGTDVPVACLDVLDGDRGRLLFDGCEERPGSMLRLVHLNPGEAHRYLAAWVEQSTSFVTDAPKGFSFHSGGSHDDFCSQTDGEEETPLVAIKLDGRVGIGTEEPHTSLEVTNKTSGRFLFNLDRKVNPALGIVNLRPGSRENYLTTGVDNDAAAFVTDSDRGFVFRAGGEAGTDDNEIDINQGRELSWILPDGHGKLSIGRYPDDYQLDVNGLARSFGFYVDTDRKNLTAVEPLPEVLDKLCSLRPVTFEWNALLELEDPGAKIGLVAHEVEEFFPEAVRNNGEDKDPSKAIAYHALVSVLVKAVQEQKSTMDRMQSRLDALEKRVAALKSPPEPKL